LRTPMDLDKKFDVVICVEVAEHLEEQYADVLVQNISKLCHSRTTVIFSAAVPYQGGNNHVNEQWQTWWAKKFYQHGFGGYQSEEIQMNKSICRWYAQNIVIYKKNIPQQVKDFVLPSYYIEIVKHLKKSI